MKPINPVKLYDLSDKGRQDAIDFLEGEVAEVLDGMKPELSVSLEIILEALGAEGHEFT